MARQYKRDARGRFASGGSSGRRAGGTLAARASLRKSRQKLAAKDPADSSLKGTLSGRAQRAAVTRGRQRLQQASRASRVRLTGAPGAKIKRPAGFKPRAGLSFSKRYDEQGVLGKVAQRQRIAAIAKSAREDMIRRGVIKPPHRNQTTKAGRVRGTLKMSEKQKTKHFVIATGQLKAARRQSKAMRESGALAKRTPELMPTTVMPRAGSARKEPKIADVMRENLRKLAEADARFLRDMEREFGIKFPVPKETPTKRLPPPPGGSQSGGKDVKISTLIRENLRKLAQADARRLRDIAAITRDVPAGTLRGSGSRPRLAGSKPRLSGGKSKPPSKGKPRGKGKPKS